MRRSFRGLLAALAVLASTAFLAACGEEEKSNTQGGGTQPSGGTAIQRNSANASKTVTVGSKNFT